MDNQKDQIVERVQRKLQQRSQVGLKKYNTTLWNNTDENYIKHMQEEAMDLSNYCEMQLRMGEFIAFVCKTIEAIPNDSELGAIIREAYNIEMNAEHN